MVTDVRAVMADTAVLEQYLERQRRHALSEDVETYERVVSM